ncbi:hypothetical protein ACWEV4_08485 [Streptomyces sp. NPDC003860]
MQPGVILPITFNRKFRPWRYTVGHSELRLRSIDMGSMADFIEVTFHGVLGMKLKTVYQPLTVALAEPAQAEEILRFSDVREAQYSLIRCLALKSDSGDGLVACLGYSIWSHPKGSEHVVSGDRHPDAVLIRRG